MSGTKLFSWVTAVAVVCGMALGAMADDPPDLYLEHLLNFEWTGAGADDYWQNSANWTAPAFPNDYPYTIPTYPDDPGRVEDPDATTIGGAIQTITPVIGADLSGPLTSDLTVEINSASDVTVASLKLGGTGATAVTTDVTGTSGGAAGRLVFENGEATDTVTNPGDEFANPVVHPDPIWSFNQGRALIWSTGTAGIGTENKITADVQLNDNVDVEGDRALHIYGDIYEGVRDLNDTVTFDDPPATSISNLLDGQTLYIHGNVYLDVYDENAGLDGTQDRHFMINDSRGVLSPPDPNAEDLPEEYVRHGTVDISGNFVFDYLSAGRATVEIGSPSGGLVPISTVILRADNDGEPDPLNPGQYLVQPTFEGQIIQNRVNLVLANDGALGAGGFRQGNPSNSFGFNLISDDDDRVIPRSIQIAQWQTVKGASDVEGIESIGDHSIEFSGTVGQSNTRGWVNLLPAGKELVLSGPQYPLQGGDNADSDRIYTIDGSGLTKITGGIHNRPADGTNPGNGHFRVRGTGTVIVDFDPANTTDTPSDYSGNTWVEGSNLHFHKDTDFPGTAVLSSGGAVGMDTTVVTNTNFLTKFRNSSDPWIELQGSMFHTYFDNANTIFTIYSDGGLMLAPGEYGQDLNFNSGSLTNVANMTLAAQEGGSTYTGTITPSTSIPTNPNTYMLGGGSGALTLPDNNQLTGTNGLLVTNGGEVRLEGDNSYTGPTAVRGKYTASVQSLAAADRANLEGDGSDSEDVFDNNSVRRSSTLTATHLANGGSASSIGSSSSAAENLVVHGATLKYVGAATSTDRLFTVGTAGGTIDASGSGALVFTSTAALGIDVPADRYGVMKQSVVGGDDNEIFGIPDYSASGHVLSFETDDLVVGMPVTDDGTEVLLNAGAQLVDDDSPLVITEIAGSQVIKVGETDLDADNESDSSPPEPWDGIPGTPAYIHAIHFGPAPARMLTLTGTNTGNNTLMPLIEDAANRDEEWTIGGEPVALGGPGGNGSVGIRKSGVGTWILANDNIYTGETQVDEGTLIINGDQSAASGLTTVAAGATLGGGGILGGDLDSSGTVAPGASAGTLTVGGLYTQNEGATLAVEIGGTGAGQYDVLAVLGTPEAATDVSGDYNGNGLVDAADYSAWRDVLAAGGTELTNDSTPGTVDESDYDYWKAHFGEGGSVGSAAELAGQLAIDLIDGFTPTVGDTFTVLTAGSITDNGLTLSGESAGFSFLVNATSIVLTYTGASGTLLAANVPEPSSLLLAGLAMLAVAYARRRC